MVINSNKFDTIVYEDVMPSISKAFCLYSKELSHGNLSINPNRYEFLKNALEKRTQVLIDVLTEYVKSECEIHKKILSKSNQT